MNRLLKCVLAAALLSIVSQAEAGLIVNGSFESYNAAGGTNFGGFERFFSPPANTSITGWTITGSSGGNPNNVDLTDSSIYAAYDGKKSLDMEGDAGASGVINQSFATTAGGAYTLSFAYANNAGGAGAVMNVLVTGAGTLLDQDVSHSTSTFANMDYRLFSANFVADSATTTLQFSALTNSGFGIALDAVSVDAVATPEPSTLATLALGVAVALVHRRRRKSVA